jgi:hypothetical protein
MTEAAVGSRPTKGTISTSAIVYVALERGPRRPPGRAVDPGTPDLLGHVADLGLGGADILLECALRFLRPGPVMAPLTGAASLYARSHRQRPA